MVHIYGIDYATTRQGLRDMLILDHLTSVELLRSVQIDWLWLYF